MNTKRTALSAAILLIACLTSPTLRADKADDKAEEFIKSLGGSSRRDATLEGNPIVYVRLRGLRERKITDADLKGLTGLKHLTALDLFSTRVTDAGVAVAKNFKDLESLNLTHTEVTDDCLKYLKDLPKLRDLRLEGTGVSDAGLSQLKEFKQLRTLSVTDTRVSKKALREFRIDRPMIKAP